MKRHPILAAIAAGVASAQQLHVTVYDKAQLPAGVIEDVSRQVRRIFGQAGISVNTVSGDPGSAEASVVVYNPPPRSPSEYHQAACRARRDIAVDILAEAPFGFSKGTLGLALPFADVGLNVRVFADHAAEAASRQSRPYAAILAHAIAHECGHVLLKANGHEPYGLMASVWQKYEWGLMTFGQVMFFTREQSQRMRATLTRDGCDSSPRNPTQVTAVQH